MDRIRNFTELHEKARQITTGQPPVRVVLSGAEDESGLAALEQARAYGTVAPALVGEKAKILEIMARLGIDPAGYDIHDEPVDERKAEAAVRIIREGGGEVLMKGLISSSTFLKPVFSHETGLLSGGFVSHCGVLQVPGMDRLIIQTDGAINIAPDLVRKKGIIINAVAVAHMLGVERPKVALIAATEKVHPKMPVTLDEHELAVWAKDAVKDADVEGPMGLDMAVSPEAAMSKGGGGPVAGYADVLFAPYIEVGNVIYKSLRHFAHAEGAGIVVGARCPVLLTSRSDPSREKLNSIALGVLYACQSSRSCKERWGMRPA